MAKSGIARTIEKTTGGQSKKERKEIDDYGENDEYKSRKKRISVDLVSGTNKKLMEYNVSNLFFQDGK